MVKSGTNVTMDKVPGFLAGLRYLDTTRVLVGIPSTKAGRTTDDDGNKTPINNAAIGFIQENGDPELNLPARPWLKPGAKKALPDVMEIFKRAAKSVMDGDAQKADRYFNSAGLTAQKAVKDYLQNAPFAPLSPRTIAARFRQRQTQRRRKSETKYLDLVAGGMSPQEAQDAAGIKPLINTAQLLNSISYVLRTMKPKMKTPRYVITKDKKKT